MAQGKPCAVPWGMRGWGGRWHRSDGGWGGGSMWDDGAGLLSLKDRRFQEYNGLCIGHIGNQTACSTMFLTNALRRKKSPKDHLIRANG